MISWRTAVVVAAVATSVGAPDNSTTLEVKAFAQEGRVLTSVTSAANWTPDWPDLDPISDSVGNALDFLWRAAPRIEKAAT